MLSAQSITIRHAQVFDFSLDLAPGQLIGLAGPSGSGKTSIARALAGIVAPDAGTVLIDGHRITYRRRSRPTQVALIGQQPRAACNPRWTLREIISEPQRIAGRPATPDPLCDEVNLDRELLDRKPADVSDGQLQRAVIARALAQRPRYLVCDEPTSALDPNNRQVIADLLRQVAANEVGVLLISHDARLIDDVADNVRHLG
ncbi:ABC transporter ATP-binding protein [Corynebacterium sp. H130]|uniref:ABC transporter ATP-binding protein n=1 Tax=Corynebacterium sp. H130 TaxID=3133444 RepID=UPI0030A1287E